MSKGVFLQISSVGDKAGSLPLMCLCLICHSLDSSIRLDCIHMSLNQYQEHLKWSEQTHELVRARCHLPSPGLVP